MTGSETPKEIELHVAGRPVRVAQPAEGSWVKVENPLIVHLSADLRQLSRLKWRVARASEGTRRRVRGCMDGSDW